MFFLKKHFADASEEQKKAACDEMAKGNYFFNVFTGIGSGAYYSDPKCWKAIGDSGNMPIGGSSPDHPRKPSS